MGAQEPDELGFDPDALRKRYQQEREKRLRPDGNEQYRQPVGEFAHLLDDPWAEPIERAALTDDVDVVIVGGGFCGLLTGARLREAGVDRIRIIETGGDVGGTWYWNRYPGAQCDIESYIYLPLLEEVGYMPKEKYSYRAEIFAHAQAIARKYDLYRDACFQTQVSRLEWSEDANRWIIHTDRNDRMRARFICTAIGSLSRPKLPGIPGIETFEGHTFHTSRWDYGYTRGDASGKMPGLADKKVGLVGTGASAVQVVPHLGRSAEHLYVFQRTPSSIDARGNRPTDPEWVKSLTPGWQQRRIENFSVLTSGGFAEEDLVSDGWTDIIRELSGLAQKGNLASTPEEIMEQVELADFRKMESIRRRIEELVPDESTAEALKPWYRQFCKRPCFHDDYLPTFARDNVTLVDTDGQGVEKITPTGAVVAGREYPLDCLIYATGFEVGTAYSRRADCDIVGRAGLTLSKKWATTWRTFQGLLSNGFPNCFLMGGMQSGVTPNFTELYGEQSTHVAYIVSQARERGVDTVEATTAAEDAWQERLTMPGVGAQSAFQADCTPGYYNNEGKLGQGPGWFGGSFEGGAPQFFLALREWRERGELEGLELT